MLIVVKLLIVALAVIGQHKLFPENKPATETELETIALPEENPETVLARRAMEAEGLCHSPAKHDSAEARTDPDWAHAPALPDTAVGHALAESCD